MKKKKIILGALIFISLFLVLSLASAEHTPPLPGAPTYIDIGVEKANEMIEESMEEIILLDVRTEGEYSADYIPGAINIPKDVLENRIEELDKSKMIIVYCKSDSRSRTASETLVQHGFDLVYNMIGGIEAWKEKFATSIATPKLTPTLTETPVLTPSLTASPSLTPTPIPSSTTAIGGNRGIPGFEAVFAMAALLVISFLIFGRRKRGDKK